MRPFPATKSKAGRLVVSHLVVPMTPGPPFSLRLRPLIRSNSCIPKPQAPRIMHATIQRVEVLEAWAIGATNTKAGDRSPAFALTQAPLFRRLEYAETWRPP